MLNIKKTPLPDGQFFREAKQKTAICLHFTAGTTAAGAIAQWKSDPIQVGTAYIVEQNGTINEMFPPSMWAYHLGIAGADAAHRNDKRTIGIEIVNPGPLRLRNGQLCFWPNNWTAPFCRVTEKERYLAAEYRGEKYFATFPNSQVQAVLELVRQLCRDFSIPPILPPFAWRRDFNFPRADAHTGILSHQNFNMQKSDIGPAFPWEVLDKGLLVL